MSPANDPISRSEPSRSVVAAVPFDQRAEALRLLLTGSPSGPATVVQPFLNFMQQQGVTLDHFYGMYVQDRLAAACLILPSPGRTGMLFISPASDRRRERWCASAVAHATEQLDVERYRLVQALLEPTQIGERRALEQAGYSPLATLLYMSRPAAHTPVSWQEEDRLEELGIESSTWSAELRPLFARAIEATYVDTLDCPGLVGTRTIDDVIAGHMSTGTFDPALWRVYHRGDEPVAITLFAAVQDEGTYELVYLGVCPGHRGRGIADQVLRRGLIQLAGLGARRIYLAVDQDNTPARRLYAALGFRALSRKVALIKTL